MNRYRPSFLLRSLSLGASVLAAFGLYVVTSNTLGVAVAVATLIPLWYLGVEAGFFALILEKLFSGWLLPKNGTAENIWFFDSEMRSKTKQNRMKQKLSKNSALQ